MNFKDLGLHPLIQAGVDESNFVECTPIQAAAIPPILEGRDVAGLAQTGTGKTAAFLLPLMDRILRSKAESTSIAETNPTAVVADVPVDPNVPVAEAPTNARPIFKGWRKTNFILILVPTRELCDQVCDNAAKFGKTCGLRATAIYGGTGYESQKAALRGGVEFIVATPGRLIDLYKENLVDLGQVRAIIFDEADRMFDMGFKDDMKYVLRRVPNDRQFLVFSATLNFDVMNTAYEFGANPVDINVSRDQAKAENVEDEILHIGHTEKPKILLSVLKKRLPKQAIIFSNFKHNVERISRFLSQNGVPAMGISSLISQSQRTRIMDLFRAENDSNILVATDVAARGLDIKGVDLVINFELPDDAENYVHRIGRTGRAGEKGKALSLVSERDVEALGRIETYLGHKVTIGWIDDADIIKEFKEFPRDRDFSDRPHGDRGSHDRPRSGGGHRPGGSRGGPRDHRGGDRSGGRPQHGGGHHGERTHSERPHGDRPHAGDRPQGDRPHGEHRNDRPHQSHRNDNRRPHPTGEQPRPHSSGRPQHKSHSGPRPHQRHATGGAAGAAGSTQGRDHRSQPHQHRKPQTSGNRSYTHRPGAPATKAASGSVMNKVRGFLKKLFS